MAGLNSCHFLVYRKVELSYILKRSAGMRPFVLIIYDTVLTQFVCYTRIKAL